MRLWPPVAQADRGAVCRRAVWRSWRHILNKDRPRTAGVDRREGGHLDRQEVSRLLQRLRRDEADAPARLVGVFEPETHCLTGTSGPLVTESVHTHHGTHADHRGGATTLGMADQHSADRAAFRAPAFHRPDVVGRCPTVRPSAARVEHLGSTTDLLSFRPTDMLALCENRGQWPRLLDG